MKAVPNLSLGQVYPAPVGGLNLNTCHDPDCGNHGVSAHLAAPRILGRNAPARKAALRSNAAAIGLGAYKLDGTAGADYRRVSSVFEYEIKPRTWLDRKSVECQFNAGRGPCGVHFELLSNVHLLDEIARLQGANGIFAGPACKTCGRDYLDAPAEFVFDGAEHTKPKAAKAPARADGREANGSATPDRIRLIHAPCRGRKGSRISATLDHRRHRRSADNLAILSAIVNGTGIRDIVRLLAPAGSGKKCGPTRVYERIYWLERVLLAFEKVQLARWRARVEASGEPVNHHLAHDDVVLTVNWETSEDQRLTHLNCSATADVRSGYVFRIDVDFDPTVHPVSVFEKSYLDGSGEPVNLRAHYAQASGRRFTAPLMGFQRPTGRYEEHHLFAAAAHQLKLFRDQTASRMAATSAADLAARDQVVADLTRRMEMIDDLHHRYFNVWDAARDYGATFSGVMTRDVYTKAAHFALLREMLPAGGIRLITEQEAILPRILPHVFRDEIVADAFRWITVSFDKEVGKPVMQARVGAFRDAFAAFVDQLKSVDPAAETAMTNGQRLRAFIAANLDPATRVDRNGVQVPFPTSNFQQPFMPLLWVRSPIQTAGETNKVVGFPLMRAARRRALKAIAFDGPIAGQDMREALANHVYAATLQPVSSFFNALRERLSFAQRAGGRSARTGNNYVNGAAYDPRVLIATLNIFRVWFNWFEPRQYEAPWRDQSEEDQAPPATSTRRIPGTDRTITVAARGVRTPIKLTPAMRLGIQEQRRDTSGALVMPSIHRMLYRPWLFYGTPLWDKFERPAVDRRSMRYRADRVEARAVVRAPCASEKPAAAPSAGVSGLPPRATP